MGPREQGRCADGAPRSLGRSGGGRRAREGRAPPSCRGGREPGRGARWLGEEVEMEPRARDPAAAIATAYLPAATRSRGSGRRRVREPVRPLPIQIPTVGARGQSARGRGRDARGAAATPPGRRRLRFRGEGRAGHRKPLESPSPRACGGEGPAADATGLRGKARAEEPLARVSVFPVVKWDQLQRRPQYRSRDGAEPSRGLWRFHRF